MWPDIIIAPMSLVFEVGPANTYTQRAQTMNLITELGTPSSPQTKIVFFYDETSEFPVHTQAQLRKIERETNLRMEKWPALATSRQKKCMLIDYNLDRIEKARREKIYTYILPAKQALTRRIWCDSMVSFVFFAEAQCT